MPTHAKVNEYHVLNPDIEREVGGAPIIERGGGARVVLMEADQAQFWIDQGVLGEKPGTVRSGAALGEHRHKDKGDKGDKGGAKALPPKEPEVAAKPHPKK